MKARKQRSLKQLSKVICKRTATVVMVIATVACLSACGKGSGSSLKERGQHVVDLIVEKANNDFYMEAMLSNNHEDNEYIKEFRKMDYDKPRDCYLVTIDDGFLEELFEEEDVDFSEFLDMSEELQATFRSQIMTSLITNRNSRSSGYQAILASSALNAGCMFMDKSLADKRELLLLIYEDAYPIAVSLSGSKDGAVSATGLVIFEEDFEADSANDVKESFCDYLDVSGSGILEDYLTVEKLK